MSKELKRCPFCGGRGFAGHRVSPAAEDGERLVEAIVECEVCGAELHSRRACSLRNTERMRTELARIEEIWNIREGTGKEESE